MLVHRLILLSIAAILATLLIVVGTIHHPSAQALVLNSASSVDLAANSKAIRNIRKKMIEKPAVQVAKA